MVGKVGRFSILYLMAIVLLVAIDCGLLRSLWDSPLGFPLLVTLPTINVMIVTSPRLRPGRTWWRFWIGFDVVVLVLAILFTVLFFSNEALTRWPINWFFDKGWISVNHTRQMVVTLFLVIYSLPQFMPAIIFGLFLEGYRLVIVRRPYSTNSVPSPSAVES